MSNHYGAHFMQFDDPFYVSNLYYLLRLSETWAEAARGVIPEAFQLGDDWVLDVDNVTLLTYDIHASIPVVGMTGPEPVPVSVILRNDMDRYFRGESYDRWVSPNECPGTVIHSTTISEPGGTVDLRFDSPLGEPCTLLFRTDVDNRDLGYPDGPLPGEEFEDWVGYNASNAVVFGTLTVTIDFTAAISWPDNMPALRQIHRDDGLGPGGAPRSTSGRTSKQLSLRQRSYW